MTVASGAGALYLAGCGGASESDSSAKGSGLLTTPEDTTARAKAGGILRGSGGGGDTGSWDVSTARSSSEVGPGSYTYPRLLKFKVARYPDQPIGEVEGDLAESFELSPDKLQLTMKLRQGLRWDAKAPTSGREIDTQDVMATWSRFTRLSAFRGTLLYSEGTPDGPVESLASPDSRTLVFKLRQPNAAINQLFAQKQGLLIMPREADGGFDPKAEVRGYGPWLLDDYVPSARTVWRKNPDYYVKGRPFIDKIELPSVGDYAVALSQFRAGNIYTNVVTKLEDLLPTKKSLPELVLQQGNIHSLSSDAHIGFGYGEARFRTRESDRPSRCSSTANPM